MHVQTAPASQTPQMAADLLHSIFATSGLDVQINILAGNGQSPSSALPFPGPATDSSAPILAIDFTGPDTPLLTSRNGELLLALEQLTTQVLRLAPDQHDRVSFDAANFKASRHLQLQQQADAAVASVRSTGAPYAFAPMTSRERRLLHLALAASGLPTASAGEGPRRHVVLYPQGFDAASLPAAPSTTDRTTALRDAFRRR